MSTINITVKAVRRFAIIFSPLGVLAHRLATANLFNNFLFIIYKYW